MLQPSTRLSRAFADALSPRELNGVSRLAAEHFARQPTIRGALEQVHTLAAFRRAVVHFHAHAAVLEQQSVRGKRHAAHRSLAVLADSAGYAAVARDLLDDQIHARRFRSFLRGRIGAERKALGGCLSV